MTSWRDEYLGALRERDKREKANQPLYASYTRLADKTAGLQVTSAREPPQASAKDPTSSPNPPDRKASRDKTPDSPDVVAKVRQDLSEAQRSRGLIETRLQRVEDELKKLKIQASLDGKRIGELTREKATLTTAVRDRDEELLGKTKLLKDVHDETVSLTLELNMAEERSRKLGQDNENLVARWMKRMGEEADAMNEESKFS